MSSSLKNDDIRDVFRIITCGSVDDGKSTLIGRLLYDARQISEDQLAALRADSVRLGTRGDDLDLALLVDGLAAERQQGITIDVAYRYLSTLKRHFIIADCPGHEQYTRNMVTGASTADAAVILVDARKGVLKQTQRHAYLSNLLGIRHLILAVNKMDAVDWSCERFYEIRSQFSELATNLGLRGFHAVPLSALNGDNTLVRSRAALWYEGPSVMELLEGLPAPDNHAEAAFRMPVQWISRPNADFRGYSGLITAGRVRPGDSVSLMPGGQRARVTRVVTADGDLDAGEAGRSVTLTLDTEIDVSRGDVMVAASSPCEVADQFECDLVWMDQAALLPGRPYLLKLGTRTVRASVTAIKHVVDVSSCEVRLAKRLHVNEIAVCRIELEQPIAFEPYSVSRELGGFILIDRMTNRTAGAGMLRFALRRAHNLKWQPLSIDKPARASMRGQRGRVIWLTGLSGAGKSTIADLVEHRLYAQGLHTYLLDGDNIRHGLNRDLGFTEEDRVENVRRVAEVARLMVDAGLVVLVSLISPFRAERRMARELLEPGEFVEVFVDAPLEVAEARDVKGLYRKARNGQLKNFTGIDSPYEAPEAPEIALDTTVLSAIAAADRVVSWLEDNPLT